MDRIKSNNKQGVNYKKNDNLHSCICNHPQVVNSPLKNDHVNIKYHTTGEV